MASDNYNISGIQGSTLTLNLTARDSNGNYAYQKFTTRIEQ